MKTFGLDTNIVLRLIVDDDPDQRRAALTFGAGLGREHNAFLSLISLVELDWALRSQYGFQKTDVATAIGKLLHTRGLTVEQHSTVIQALRLVEIHNADFADTLIACRSLDEGCVSVKTFDKKAAGKIPGMELLA
ncbi:type II toxin-antitoxin system VapC family toxin [Pararhizobium sp. YC-54]|uniref:PIN domain-containing protein n=1 Tax=Pararhizobium sp. YC-54 TaxID=2986920 RepID=UPI0021F73BA4|nr:type II toxin-antitoxin system VapC family toxin [Pararhizobium sp. YC-54]MCV9998518.1 type II toxin-antitoxin system VapC family toxin [Pararhizobium sp. YC-54]